MEETEKKVDYLNKYITCNLPPSQPSPRGEGEGRLSPLVETEIGIFKIK
jgi:hypothetical protein